MYNAEERRVGDVEGLFGGRVLGRLLVRAVFALLHLVIGTIPVLKG